MPSPPANTLDRRLHVYRDDVADARLRDQVTAARYIEGHAYKIVADIAPVHPKPLRDTNLDTQAFYGEAVTVFEIENGLAWSQLSRDGYVGYIPFDCVAVDTSGIATHKVAAPQTFIYSDADAAAKPLGALALGTTFRVERETDRFVEVTYRSITGYVSKWHLEPIDAVTQIMWRLR